MCPAWGLSGGLGLAAPLVMICGLVSLPWAQGWHTCPRLGILPTTHAGPLVLLETNQGDYKREEPLQQQPGGFLKLSIFLAARAAIQVWHLSPLRVAAGFSVKVTRADAWAQSYCHTVLCPFAVG